MNTFGGQSPKTAAQFVCQQLEREAERERGSGMEGKRSPISSSRPRFIPMSITVNLILKQHPEIQCHMLGAASQGQGCSQRQGLLNSLKTDWKKERTD